MAKKVFLFLNYWLPFLIWAIVIFMFSANPTTRASEIHWQDFVIKKTAHVVEYFVFTALLLRALISQGIFRRFLGRTAFIAGLFYAISDEFHQSFTPGREPTVRDIMFDVLGILFALFFVLRFLPSTGGLVRLWANKLGIIKS
jgi:VanZ family protein